MKLITKKFKSGGLHEKHVVTVEIKSSFCMVSNRMPDQRRLNTMCLRIFFTAMALLNGHFIAYSPFLRAGRTLDVSTPSRKSVGLPMEPEHFLCRSFGP